MGLNKFANLAKREGLFLVVILCLTLFVIFISTVSGQDREDKVSEKPAPFEDLPYPHDDSRCTDDLAWVNVKGPFYGGDCEHIRSVSVFPHLDPSICNSAQDQAYASCEEKCKSKGTEGMCELYRTRINNLRWDCITYPGSATLFDKALYKIFGRYPDPDSHQHICSAMMGCDCEPA